MRATTSPLDLRSISQTKFDLFPALISEPAPVEVSCIYHAPFFAWCTDAHNYQVLQGNCHHWDCPRCGIGRAKQEYWRIVEGCDELETLGHGLWFITITTRGQGLSVKEAEENYLTWTNRFMTHLRAKCTRNADYWCYVAVTERQKRMHPHSHILTTLNIWDAQPGLKEGYHMRKGKREYAPKKCLRSEMVHEAARRSGLGEQYDISRVVSAKAVSRYVGKYLFKSSLLTTWPPCWHRVRYSNNWPATELPKTEAIVLTNRGDWYNLATCAETITCTSHSDFLMVSSAMWAYPVRVRDRSANPPGKKIIE